MIRKVRDGTPQFSTESLCETCRFSQRVKGEKYGDNIVFCHSLDKEIHFKVAQCDKYDDARHPSLYEMREIAWKFASDRAGKPIGFVNPTRWHELKEAGKLQTKGDAYEDD